MVVFGKRIVFSHVQGRAEQDTLVSVFGRNGVAVPLAATADAGRVAVSGFVATPVQPPHARGGRQLLYVNGHVVTAPQVRGASLRGSKHLPL